MSSVIKQEFPITKDVLGARTEYSQDEKREKKKIIKRLLKERDAKIVAHYYVHEDIQEIADETGGFVADSLEMARFGMKQKESTLVVAGVRFMGETAKILNPEKKIIMPTLEAECSLDLNCEYSEFKNFCDQFPEREIVVYANTSAKVKAIADWVVTSSIAVKLIEYLKNNKKKIIWAPDKHLGNYIKDITNADMKIWKSSCVVHDEFKSGLLNDLQKKHPDAAVLVHPESNLKMINLADVVGSTSQLIQASKELPNKKFIVATDNRIFYKMKQSSPDKTFIEAPSGGAGATCKSCAHCPWMAMNDLEKLENVLMNQNNEIILDPKTIEEAAISTNKMINFAKEFLK